MKELAENKEQMQKIEAKIRKDKVTQLIKDNITLVETHYESFEQLIEEEKKKKEVKNDSESTEDNSEEKQD
jgi:hypothetical protein